MVAAIARRVDRPGEVRDGLEELLGQIESELKDISGVQRVAIAARLPSWTRFRSS